MNLITSASLCGATSAVHESQWDGHSLSEAPSLPPAALRRQNKYPLL